MNVLWGAVVTVLSLLAWGGQALAWFAPGIAVRLSVMEAEDDVEPTFWADMRGEATGHLHLVDDAGRRRPVDRRPPDLAVLRSGGWRHVPVLRWARGLCSGCNAPTGSADRCPPQRAARLRVQRDLGDDGDRDHPCRCRVARGLNPRATSLVSSRRRASRRVRRRGSGRVRPGGSLDGPDGSVDPRLLFTIRCRLDVAETVLISRPPWVSSARPVRGQRVVTTGLWC